MKAVIYSIMAICAMCADTTGKENVKEGQLGTSFVQSIQVSKIPIPHDSMEILNIQDLFNPLHPANIIAYAGVAIPLLSRPSSVLEVLYYARYRDDPNVRYIRKPDDRVLLVVTISDNQLRKFVAYEVINSTLNTGPQYNILQIIQNENLSGIE